MSCICGTFFEIVAYLSGIDLALLVTWGRASEGRVREGGWLERLRGRREISGGIQGWLPDKPKPMVK